MCAIFGTLNVNPDKEWIKRQSELALQRGKDLTYFQQGTVNLYHTRTATNISGDTYPIRLGNATFAMNGIVSVSEYSRLVEAYPTINSYTVDSAYFLQLWLDKQDWSLFDSDNYVFAFWLVRGKNIYLGNKDFPLFVQSKEAGICFSSFKSAGFEPLGNSVIEYNTETKHTQKLYNFKELVYAG